MSHADPLPLDRYPTQDVDHAVTAQEVADAVGDGRPIGKTITRRNNRHARHIAALHSIRAAIGPIEPGHRSFVLSMGRFSLTEVIAHCIAEAGPVDLRLSVFAASGAEIDYLWRLVNSDLVRSVRLIVDQGLDARHHVYMAALRYRFGEETIRYCDTHAKFHTIRGDSVDLAVRGSMNLQENRGMEQIEVEDNTELCEFIDAAFDGLFAAKSPLAADAVIEREPLSAVAGELGLPTESDLPPETLPAYFGDGAFDVDVRRAGMRYGRTGRPVE